MEHSMKPQLFTQRRIILLVLVVVFLSGCSLGGSSPWGSQDYSSIQGTIVDQSGNVITQPVTISIGRTTLQTSDGTYSAPWLSPGKYVINASSPGFESQSRIVTIEPGKKVTYDIVLMGSGDAPTQHPQGSGPGYHPLEGRTIVVDPGHGGFNRNLGDFGTVGQHEKEKTNVLAIGLFLRDMLEASGAHVIMTRETDVNPSIGTRFENNPYGQLQARVDLANRSGADVYVSLHNDWHSDSSISGVKTFYYTDSGRELATYVQQGAVRQLGAIDRGVDWASFQVIRETRMPAVLMELGFLSNPHEDYLLSTNPYRLKAAQGIHDGLVRYFQERG